MGSVGMTHMGKSQATFVSEGKVMVFDAERI